MCKWKSCLKPSRQEEESCSSHVFGGLYVSPANRVSSWAAARKGLAEALGRCQPAVAPGGHWQWMGRGRRKEKPLTPDLFHILPNIKLFSPQSCCTVGPVAASEPKKCFYPPSTGCEEQWQRYHQGLCSSLLLQLP